MVSDYDPTLGVGADNRHEDDQPQPIKCCVDRAMVVVKEDKTAVLMVSGWMLSDTSDLVMLQMALPGQATVICRKVYRPDLESVVSTALSTHAGFEAYLPISVTNEPPEILHFIAHLKDGTVIPGSLFLPALVWGGQQPSNRCPLPVHYAYQKLLQSQMEQFLRAKEHLSFPYQANPDISIIIDAEERPQCLYATLLALRATTVQQSIEVVVIGHSAENAIFELLSKVSGIKTIFHAPTTSRDQSLMQAASFTKGRYLVFLRDTSLISCTTLQRAQELIESDSSIGALGGRVLRPDGVLVSAGVALLSDGSLYNYGQGEDPWLDQFLFQREVDLITSDLFVTTRELFEQLTGFPYELRTLDYHTADYCLRASAVGRKVLYHPDLLTVRASGVERGTSLNRHDQEYLRNRFQIPHSSYLISRSRPDAPQPLVARFGRLKKKTVLYLNSWQEQISQSEKTRLMAKLTSLTKQGFFVTCYLDGKQDFRRSLRSELSIEVELAGGVGRKDLIRFLQERQNYYNISVVSSLEDLQFYCHCYDALFAGRDTAVIIYDDLNEEVDDRPTALTDLAQAAEYFKRISSVFTSKIVDPDVQDQIGTKIVQIEQGKGADYSGIAEAIERILQG